MGKERERRMKKILASLILLVILARTSTVLAADTGSWPTGAIDWTPAKSTGQGSRIALIDTGISGPAIDPVHLDEGYNYLEQSRDTDDRVGHGTALAGILLGLPAKNQPGIAPDAVLVPLVYYSQDAAGKVLDGGSDLLAQAIRDAAQVYQCQIILIGAGTIGDSEDLQSAIAYAEKQGVVVVAAVGNENEDHPEVEFFPAAYETVLGVAALRADEGIATFSQRNESVKLSAPGTDLKVATVRGRTVRAFGTSYAAAYVAGGVALLRAEYPSLTPGQVRSVLLATARDIGTQGYDVDSGYGVLQINKALSKARALDEINRAQATGRLRWIVILTTIILALLLAAGVGIWIHLTRKKARGERQQP
jgi:subtilisin family serine protease